VDDRVFQLWEEVLSIATSIEFSKEEDESVWQFNSVGFIHFNLFIVDDTTNVTRARGLIVAATHEVKRNPN
jgi:hypothetical protein